jgi:hypothetical protein
MSRNDTTERARVTRRDFLRAAVFGPITGTFQVNSGFRRMGFPVPGSWLSYGLGTENDVHGHVVKGILR